MSRPTAPTTLSLFDWRGVLRPQWRKAGEWYVEELKRQGLLSEEEKISFPTKK